jgi:hypothetical protein
MYMIVDHINEQRARTSCMPARQFFDELEAINLKMSL